MLTADVGWAAEQIESGDLYFIKTSDGGKDWTRYFGSQDLAAIGFLNASDGWRSMTDLPNYEKVLWKLYRTSDGGQHWTFVLQSRLAENTATSAPFFLNSQKGFVLDIVGPEWYVLATNNGGKSFRRLTKQPLGGAGVSPIGVTFTTPQRGWTLVASTGAGAGGLNFLRTSTNGGKSWRERTELTTLATAEQFDSLSAKKGYVLAPIRAITGQSAITPVGTKLYQTINGGRSSRLIDQSEGPTLTNLVFVSRRKGFATAGSRLFETQDGGQRWHFIYRNPGLDFQSIRSLNRLSRLSQ